MTSTGYGPSRGQPYFDGDESKYELWEVKFLGHMRLQKLHETVLPVNEGGREIPEVHNIVHKDALYVPSFKQNIFSVQCATKIGSTVEFKQEVAELRSRNGTVFNIDKRGKLYYLNSVVTTKEASHSLQEWHEIMGHCNAKDVLNLEQVVSGMNITDKDMEECEVCIQGKMVEERCRIPDSRAIEPLESVHCDLAGSIEPAAKEEFRYALVFADDFSGVTML